MKQSCVICVGQGGPIRSRSTWGVLYDPRPPRPYRRHAGARQPRAGQGAGTGQDRRRRIPPQLQPRHARGSRRRPTGGARRRGPAGPAAGRAGRPAGAQAAAWSVQGRFHRDQAGPGLPPRPRPHAGRRQARLHAPCRAVLRHDPGRDPADRRRQGAAAGEDLRQGLRRNRGAARDPAVRPQGRGPAGRGDPGQRHDREGSQGPGLRAAHRRGLGGPVLRPARRRHGRAEEAGGGPRRHHGQDREAPGPGPDRGDPRLLRRRHGGPRRPGRGAGAGRSAGGPEGADPRRPQARRAGDRRHPDAGIDDQLRHPHPRRGHRRGQRRL